MQYTSTTGMKGPAFGKRRKNEQKTYNAEDTSSDKTSKSSRPKQRVSDYKGKRTDTSSMAAEASNVDSNQRMDEEEFRRFLEQFKADVKIREEKLKEQTEYEAFLSRLKADVEMKGEMERKARSAEAAERKARKAQAEAERRAKLEEEHQARIALLEAEHKAKQAEISAREAQLTIQHVGLDGSSLITCGAGMAVHNVLCGSDCYYVTIKNLPKDVKNKEVEELFLQQGADRSAFCLLNIRQTPDGKAEARVMMEAELGAVLVAGLHGSEFNEGHVLSFALDSAPNKMGLSSGKNVNVLTVSWFLPSRIMIASYPTPLDAQNAVKTTNTAFRGRGIRVEIDQGRNKTVSLESSTSVKISGLPPEAESTEVQLHAGAIGIRMVKSPIYDLTVMHDTLKTQMEQIGGLEAYDIRPANDDEKQKIVEVQARFSTWEQAKKVCDSLEGKRIRSDFPTLRTRLPKPHHYTISIPLRQYRAQKARWDSIAGSEENKGTSVRVTENTSSAIIRVSGEDRKVVGRLKVRIENLTLGEKLNGALWHRSFATPAGRKFLDDLYSQMAAFVRSDWKTQTLKIYADGEARDTALGCIEAEIDRLQSLEWSVLISRRTVGFFMRRGLPVLKEMLGDEAVSLELHPSCKLMIRGGGEEARRTVSELIKESKQDVHPTVRDSKSKTCPICQDEVSGAVLLGCEHLYCDACLRHYITTAIGRKQFPLCCVGDGDRCKIPIAIPTIQKFLSPQSFSQLVETAATTYIATHPDKFKYCDTPDCSQVYRCDGDRKSFTCPSCFVSVCIACKNVSHEGMTCEEWTLLNDVSEQERRNLEWASAAGAKQCSRCQVFIQKIEGCNRVLCLCGAHICWICLASFGDSNSTYDHLNAVHGGVFDYEIN